MLAPAVNASPASDLRRAFDSLGGLEAAFTQSFTPRGFKKPRLEKGSVVFGSLPRMKWTYTDPTKKLFLFDGERSFFYVAEDEQLTVTTLTAEQKKALPFLVLSDPAKVEKGYRIAQKSSARAITVTLTARDNTVAVPRIAVVRLPTGRLESIEYADRDGNTTRFEFSGYQKVAIDDSTFRFEAPQGTQVIEQ